jgi:hypothetical protein
MNFHPLDMFKKATSFLNREIGILEPKNHHEVNDRRSNEFDFFGKRRKSLARELYHKTKQENNPHAVIAPYERKTGLSLEDIHRAFDEGDWRAPGGKVHYGGPKWAAIAATTIKLRDALLASDEEAAWKHTQRLEELEHNNGPLVNKFGEL